MEIKMTRTATGPVYLDAVAIRKAVFIEEQGISVELEYDNEEAYTYFVGYVDGSPAVTARVREVESGVWLVQRVATMEKYRHQGHARELFVAIEAAAREHGIHQIKLHAQENAQPFYFTMNYERLGGPEIEAGIVHYWMMKVLD